jgi:adenylate kinase
VNIIFIAPPAAGKGTISSYLVDNLGFIHLSTGDMLRDIAQSDTLLGKSVKSLMKEGKFISDDIIIELVREEIVKFKDKQFILDGIPRNLEQASRLDAILEEIGVNNYVVINIDIDEDLLEKRATGRRLCPNCGASYNIYFDGFKPIVDNVCDKCQSKLIQREDDTLETFKYRYQTYLNNTKQVLDFYNDKGLVRVIDASKSTEDILSDVRSILEGVKND